MNVNDAHYKYLKYKTKYLNLKKSQTGGAFAFKNTGLFYIMAKISGDTLERVNERRAKLKLPVNSDLHITLLQLHINIANPLSKMFTDDNFYKAIQTAFSKHIKGNNVTLSSQVIDPITGKATGGLWDFLGQGTFDKKFWARSYEIPPQHIEHIRAFRIDIYNFINTFISQNGMTLSSKFKTRTMPSDPTDQTQFKIYSTVKGTNRIELYAIVKDHYLGVETWHPHVSVIKMSELRSRSQELYTTLSGIPSDSVKTKILKSAIGPGVKQMSIIESRRDIDQIRISFSNPQDKTQNKQSDLPV